MLHAKGPAGFAAALAVISTAAAAGETVIADFETMPPDQPPAGFRTAVTGEGPAGRWLVRQESEAPSGAQVLVQTSDEPGRGQFPLAIYDGLSAADVELSVSFKPISGATDQAAGLVWRYQDARNYYVVRANALEGNVVLYKVEDGERIDLPLLGQGRTYGTDAAVAANAWGTLALRAQGDLFTVSLNGAELFEVEDQTFTDAGQVGLWTKADSVTAFDDLTMTALP